MIKEFLGINKRAILSGLKVMILVLLVISLIVCTILLLNGEIPNLIIYVISIIGVSFVLPLFLTTIVCLRGHWDMKVYRKNFSSYPFCDLEKIGFRKILLNQNSKWSFIQEIYRGEINGFLIDIDIDTQQEYKYLRFRFSLMPRQEDIGDFDFNTMTTDNPKFVSGFSKILKKYHYKKHGLQSIQQLEKELTELTNDLNRKRN